MTKLFDALEYTRNNLSLATFLVDLVSRLEIKILLIYLCYISLFYFRYHFVKYLNAIRKRE